MTKTSTGALTASRLSPSSFLHAVKTAGRPVGIAVMQLVVAKRSLKSYFPVSPVWSTSGRFDAELFHQDEVRNARSCKRVYVAKTVTVGRAQSPFCPGSAAGASFGLPWQCEWHRRAATARVAVNVQLESVSQQLLDHLLLLRRDSVRLRRFGRPINVVSALPQPVRASDYLFPIDGVSEGQQFPTDAARDIEMIALDPDSPIALIRIVRLDSGDRERRMRVGGHGLHRRRRLRQRVGRGESYGSDQLTSHERICMGKLLAWQIKHTQKVQGRFCWLLTISLPPDFAIT